MLRLAWAGVAERWSLFVGAVLAVCLGVALVQSSLLLLISAATWEAPAGLPAIERMRFEEGMLVAVTVIAVSLGLSAFLAVFVIGSTFAFTVAQRRRDFALLRLVGGDRGQLRRLLLGEAVLLGTAGAALGALAGPAAVRVQAWLLETLGFVPAGFTGQWRPWILGVCVLTGVGLAVAGALSAARRAARILPLEALRDGGQTGHVMTRGRWIAGLSLAAGTVALIVLAPVAGPAGGQAMAMCVSICAALACTVLGPVVVPAMARLLPWRAAGALGLLAAANLRDDVRRTASTAAPLIVLVGLVLGQSVALVSLSAAAAAELRRGTSADLVVEADGPAGARIAAVPGVERVSTEIEVPVRLTTGTGELAYTELSRAALIDPAAYESAHPGSGSVRALRGRAAAAGPGALGISPGDAVVARVGDTDLGKLPVVAAVPARMGGGPALLLPAGAVPAAQLARAPSTSFVTLERGADRRRVTAELAAVGTVRSADAWLAGRAEAATTTSSATLLVVLGLGGLYALIGVVNTVVIAGSERRPEFAAARAIGLTRRQVVRMALAETWAVTAIGLLLGTLAAAGTLVAAVATMAAVTGDVTVAVPWPPAGALVAGVLLATGITNVLATRAAMRPALVSLLRTRE
ncbi:FtsX-like permease family protein [Nonomuraea sp. FMUSA5-5]|uniref:FtsX-like permease family protein n=1 Tax=Nonomuraea composti TaxID=2720023 RepID=A0ABX1BHA0_9ACTN|nr:ABC transporter permease [Nonomuraea sp. FMUSA5-5]NJP95119.1 FtsX-like permease family protein [Nonomuraea sp. FMUSA5-5]